MQNFTFEISKENSKIRIDKFLSQNLENISRSYIHELIKNNDILVNGNHTTKNFVLSEKDIVSVNIPKPKEIDILPENIPINIVYEDDDLLIVNKEKGIVVHPAPGNYTGTLVNALLYKCKDSLSGINGNIRPGIVHRIDKYTSGLLIIAKNDISHNFLAEQIKEHSFTREYEAIVYGNIKEDSGTIRINIARHKTDRKKMAVTDIGGKLAITHFTVLKRYGNFTHLRLKLETGRTHQIRVHMAYIKHPVLGDEVYANPKNNPFKFLTGQCLHAKSIGFIHPKTNKYIEFSSELPDYFKKVIYNLEKQIQ
ncbi:MAG: RluA family pseudouridine synthase [Clostridia bacterium]|nr:RluA family pseudouridine synthase [Clostridia bacterium]